MEKISYSIYIKNRSRKSATWTARVRQGGKTKDINLHTKDRDVAERWLRSARRALEAYNDAEADGQPTGELLAKVVRIDAPAQSRAGVEGAPAVTMASAISRFEVELRRRNCRGSTIGNYVRALNSLFRGVDKAGGATDIEKVMERFDGRSSATRHFYVSVLNVFLRFIEKTYGLRASVELPSVKVERTKDQVHWEIWQMRRIIENVKCYSCGRAVDEERTELTKLYFWLLSTSGLRQGEAYTIRWGDIDWASSQLTLRETATKARKARHVPIQAYVLGLLAQRYRAGHFAPSDGVFEGKIPVKQSSRHAVLQRAIATANEVLDIRSQIPYSGLHCFRHSVSMILYAPDENGNRPDIKAVAEILGHSEQVSLKYYQATRSAEEKVDMLNKKFGVPDMRSNVDDMIDEGLI